MELKRSSGILLPISALPSPHGIGTLGKAAYNFIDFLVSAKQSWWQILPVGPTSYGDSPYQSFSTFAGNPYFIDLDMLVEDGLLRKSELRGIDWGESRRYVNYEKMYASRLELLHLAAERGLEKHRAEFSAFLSENSSWLPDYALFMAVKKHFGMKQWTDWPDEAIRLHREDAVEKYSLRYRDYIERLEFIQYLFFTQWSRLRKYARRNGIGIIGDLPIYVAMDSADVWANPRYFLLDEDNIPTEVAGVPPDYFSEEGQLWGNPLYDWEAMKKDGYGWWIRRVDGSAKLFDVLRIDHFRGFESFWAVPYGEKSAVNGRWVKGPGMDLVGRLTSWFSGVQFIAEDLGILTPEVHEMLRESGLPGMKVLEFAFDPTKLSSYLPHRYSINCICYAGTHDNAPLAQWKAEASPEEISFAEEYLGQGGDGLCWGIIRGGMRSAAVLFVAQMQDYLELGAESRMNTPGTLGLNWQWRLLEGEADNALAERIARITEIYGRSSEEEKGDA